MSGHSKWSTIKHKKGMADLKRGKVFTKLIREIYVATKLGGETESNPRLRTAVLKARAANIPKDTIERSIKKGLGELSVTEYFENLYEGYGPDGVAIMVETLTNNRNRTAADIRSIFSKGGGNLGETGCVSYLFHRRGVIAFDSAEENSLFETAIDLGAEDVVIDGEALEIITSPESYEKILTDLQERGFTPRSSDILHTPEVYISLNEEKTYRALRLLESLDDYDDVQTVSSNLDIPEGFDE